MPELERVTLAAEDMSVIPRNGRASKRLHVVSVHQRAALHEGVESVDRVSCIQHSPQCAVGLHQAVAALDDVPVAAFLLALSVAGQGVSNIIRKGVLGVGVVVGTNGRDDAALGCGYQEAQNNSKL